MTSPNIRSFFDATTCSVTHVVSCPLSHRAAIIDSVLDYDPVAGRTSSLNAALVAAWVRDQGLTVDWLLETHAHADHLTAASWLHKRVGGRTGIGARIGEVQARFKELLDLEDLPVDGRPFDTLFEDGASFQLGALSVRVLHTPGHTPACVSYLVGDDAFIGDTLFMPDFGSARADFPGGDAATLYRSIRRLLALPPHTRLHLCHDYPPTPREPHWVTTVAEQRASNVHAREGVSEAEFVALRQARDRSLGTPRLMWPAVQVNLRAGQLPAPAANGRRYLKIPLNRP